MFVSLVARGTTQKYLLVVVCLLMFLCEVIGAKNVPQNKQVCVMSPSECIYTVNDNEYRNIYIAIPGGYVCNCIHNAEAVRSFVMGVAYHTANILR